MTRRQLNLLTLLSLLMCVATAALWVRSHFARDGLWYTRGPDRYSLHSYRGRLWFWKLSDLRYVEASVWTTPAKMGAGFVWDSAPDSWYDPFRGHPKGVRVPDDFLDAASFGGTVDRRFLGFRYVRNANWAPLAQLQAGYPTASSTAVYVPDWSVVALAAALPAARLARLARSRRRRSRGLCPACGYDLRATPQQCPECGAAPAALRPPVHRPAGGG
jgi:hypothetical protein